MAAVIEVEELDGDVEACSTGVLLAYLYCSHGHRSYSTGLFRTACPQGGVLAIRRDGNIVGSWRCLPFLRLVEESDEARIAACIHFLVVNKTLIRNCNVSNKSRGRVRRGSAEDPPPMLPLLTRGRVLIRLEFQASERDTLWRMT